MTQNKLQQILDNIEGKVDTWDIKPEWDELRQIANNSMNTKAITQAITDIRKYQDRMSIDGRAIQHIADSLEKLIK